jgi:DNA-binding MarR family transcriptional regulator
VTDGIPESLRYRLSYLLGNLYRRSLELESDALARVGTGVKQQAALAVLADDGPMSQQRLGQRLGIDRTTIVTVVDALEHAGLVARTRDPTDRRSYLVTLTRPGQTKQRHGRRVVYEAERALLEGLNEQERRTLTQLLVRALTSQA